MHALFRYRTSNIGDDTQSYATALLLPRIDALVDRDQLSSLALAAPHRCVMNSWFFLGHDRGPPSPSIEPVFHGLSVGRSEMLRGAWLEYLRAHAPIGCRDRRSVELLRNAGVDAYWSGCLTLMIGQSFEPVPLEQRSGVYIIDVHPEVEARRVPPALSARAIRWTNEFDPLISESTGRRFAEVHRRMRLLARAELVITRRLHIALPCAGFGTPVLTLPNPGISDARHRFSGYESFLPVAWPESEGVDFDFDAPSACAIPEVLREAYARLCDRLGHMPERLHWDAETAVDFPVGDAPSEHGRFALEMSGDLDVWPLAIDGEGRRVLRVSGHPFAHKMAARVAPAPAGPKSAEAALEVFAVRRVVGLIAEQFSVETNVVALDTRMRELAQGELFAPVMAFWTPTLRAARHRDLEANWRRAAVAFGTDAYETGRLADVVWRSGDAAAARAVIADMRRALSDQTFAAHGDDFHRGKNAEILDGFEALLVFDDGAIPPDDPRLQALHPYVVAAIYDVMWDAHTAGESARAVALGLLYIRATAALGHGPETPLWITAHILLPLGAFAAARDVLAALSLEDADPGHRWRGYALIAAAARETGDAGLHAEALTQLSALATTLPVDAMLNDPSWADAYVLATGLADREAPGAAQREIARLASYAHDARARTLSARLALEALPNAHNDEALALSRAAASSPPAALGDAGLTAVDVLSEAGAWSDAARLYAAGNAALWDAPGKLGGAWRTAGRRGADALPETGWIWSGRGIGDDVLRLKMLTALKGRERPYRYDIDPRLAPLAARALPAMRFESTPRAVGFGAVGRSAFWKARNGVPRAFDAFRVTRDRLDALRRGEQVMQGEDILCAYLEDEGRIAADAAPILAPGAPAVARATAWLAGADRQLRNICLAWRSGVLDRERRKYFLALEDLAPLWSIPDVRWIIVQHDLTPEERELIARTPQLCLPPDLDARNDFDALVALFSRADGMVAPKLSTRDIAAASGARVASMSLGHTWIEGARLAPDGMTDRIFPNIRHVRERPGVDRAGAIAEVAHIVRGWS